MDEKYPHIGMGREPDVEPERRRGPPFGKSPPRRPESSHGTAIQQSVDSAVSAVEAARQTAGISPDRLLVLEFSSLDPGCRNVFEERFGASVVEERLVRDGDGKERTRVLVQFPSLEAISRLKAEAEQYRQNSSEKAELPPGIRRKFFDGLGIIRAVSRDERVGSRLREEGYPDQESFFIDVDLWHPGIGEGAYETLNDLRRICNEQGGQVVEDLRTSSLVLARVKANRELAETLLDLDLVAQVNLPPVLPVVYESLFDDIDPLPDHTQPTGSEPVVVVIDSGVLAAHPLFRGWVVDEMDFDSGEGTAVDKQGHGTQVAGLAMYGNMAQWIENNHWSPDVLIASAKVLRCSPEDFPGPSRAMFPDNHRPEALVERAIRHYHETRGCRVFNLSAGNGDDVYAGGRQFAWAEVLDKLARELDILIVVAAGNNPNPVIPDGEITREIFQGRVRDGLISDPSARLCSPATSALSVTVGAFARSARPRTQDSFAGAPEGAPAPFSRVGPGYESKATQCAVKPDFVAYGGNFAINRIGREEPGWVTNDLHLGEPTTKLITDDGRPLTTVNGTSYATPQVSHAAAWALDAASKSLGSPASANTARAILGVSAETPPCGGEWLLDPNGKETWDKLRLAGYGMVNAELVRASLANDVLLIASDSVEEDHWHVYEVAVPPAFFSGRGKRGITVSLAFDPPVRSSRREYLARTMWLEVMKGLEIEEVIEWRSPYPGPRADAPKFPQSKLLDLRPARTDIQWSTLQVRRKMWARKPSLPEVEHAEDPLLHVVVGCQKRFPHGEDPNQRYSVAMRFWHSNPQIDLYQPLNLYQQLQARVRTHPLQARVERRG